jgi:hypothetical protein
VSSTRPITFASIGRGALALMLGALAVVVILASGRDALGVRAVHDGRVALAAAMAKPRGVERDAILADAQTILQHGLSLTPSDPRLWNLLGETRLMQATQAAVTEISPDLLAAAGEASIRAASLAPRDPEPQARLAYVRSLQEERQQEAAEALARAFATEEPSAALIARRIGAAARSWDALDQPTRQGVLADVCALSKQGGRETLRQLRLGAARPGLALEIDRLLEDPACGALG